MRIRPLTWLRNKARNQIRASMVGSILAGAATARRIRVVAVTALPAKVFWRTTPLGRSLVIWKGDHRLVLDLAFEHAGGLPAAYNAAIDRAGADEAVLFVQETVWLRDGRWPDKLLAALERFDVVGLPAGSEGRPEAVPFKRPVLCQELRGPFLACLAGMARRWCVRFDERSSLLLHDVDFCRSARAAGWSLGAWPLDVVHEVALATSARREES